MFTSILLLQPGNFPGSTSKSLEALSLNGSRIMGVSAVPDVQWAGCAADSNRKRCKRCQTSALWKP